MSTSRSSTAPAPSLDISSTPRIGFATLARIELRKSFDTRAGRWFTIAIIGIVVLVMLAQAFLFERGFGLQDYSSFIAIMGNTLGFFLPVLPILLVTSEWSQRTGLVTFALEPRRLRVIAAKFVAGFVLVVAVLLVAFAVGALGVLLSGLRGIDPSWALSYNQIQGFVLANLIKVLVGFAIAMLLMNSPASLVAYFFYAFPLPLIVALLSATISWFADLAPWIEFNRAQRPLFDGDFRPEGQEWAQIATAGMIWLVIPLVLGLIRLLRSEVK